MRLRPIATILVLASAVACVDVAVTFESWLDGEEITAHFKGTEIDGHYASGRTFSERYGRDGRLEYRERDRHTRGRWSVEAGAFCTIYDQDPTGGCYRVRRVGGNCFEFYFVARTEEQARRDPNAPSWTARGWINTLPATCADGASV